MNKTRLIQELRELELPQAELPGHRQRLEAALLDSGSWNKRTLMTRTKRLWPAGALAAFALVTVLANLDGSLSSVSAQELARRSYQTAAELPADQQAELKRLFGDDVLDQLAAAGQATDLQLFTFEEYTSEHSLPAQTSDQLRNMTFLQYAEADGRKVIIGVDRDNSLVGFKATSKAAE